jgi:preprotein translocase subunit YajC
MNKLTRRFLPLVALLTAFINLPAWASASAAAPSKGQSITQMLVMFALFIGVFYFLLIRPQNKKNREHRQLMSSINVGDEIITAGGILAKVKTLKEQYVVLSLNDDQTMVLQRSSIASVLPKGTLSGVAH